MIPREDKAPIVPSWRFRLGEFLIRHNIPLVAGLVVLIWFSFVILVSFLWKACG